MKKLLLISAAVASLQAVAACSTPAGTDGATDGARPDTIVTTDRGMPTDMGFPPDVPGVDIPVVDVPGMDVPVVDVPVVDVPVVDVPGTDVVPPRDVPVTDTPRPDVTADVRPDVVVVPDTGPDVTRVDVVVDAGACSLPTIPTLTLTGIAGGATFSSPIFVTQAPGSTDTLWVVERGGRIRLVRGGAILATPFLDVSGRITAGGEQGLLGLAFHPNYVANGRFFIYYTASGGGNNVVAEYSRMSADVANPAEVRRLVNQPDFAGNHNGGMIAFGPDNFLYVGMGDGGGGGDPMNYGLNTSVLLGKLLRLDVDNMAGMFAAAGNPFSGATGLPQIWAYGLRNPWRFSFDRMTGDLYIGDVGQGVWEEVDVQPAGAPGGRNYGWRAYEANAVYSAADLPRATTHTAPVVAVRHGSGTEVLRASCSITGGYVYRGSAIPALRGGYLFGDYCSSDVAVMRWCGGTTIGSYARLPGVSGSGGLASFGQDNAGEMYIAFVDSGRVVRIGP